MLALAALIAACNGESAGCPLGSSRAAASDACAAEPPRQLGVIESDALLELSGMCASRAHPGVLYAHNDSGDAARFFALDQSGHVLGEYTLTGASALDWEDIALGSSGAGADTLFIADSGNNGARDGSAPPRTTLQIYRVREPDVDLAQAPQQNGLSWDRLLLRYPDQPHDAETLLFDARRDELLLVTKETDGRSLIYRAPASAPAETLLTLERETALPVGCGLAENPLFTGGDISRDGAHIALLSYTSLFTWRRQQGESVSQALTRPPDASSATSVTVAEAVTFSADGGALLVSGEGWHAPLVAYAAGCR